MDIIDLCKLARIMRLSAEGLDESIPAVRDMLTAAALAESSVLVRLQQSNAGERIQRYCLELMDTKTELN